LFGTKYRLAVRLYPDAGELRVIREHHLERIEVFADPLRDAFAADAIAAHDKAKARGIFVVPRMRDTAAITASELSALVSTLRALLAFKINVADLLRGVSIEHRSLRAIADIEKILTDYIDALDAAVRSARGYADRTEDVFAPGDDAPDETIRPNQWTRSWTR
jgi:hypothetical protein